MVKCCRIIITEMRQIAVLSCVKMKEPLDKTVQLKKKISEITVTPLKMLFCERPCKIKCLHRS
uniref:Uncharacterized protein n=1 Tax=Anguilla anguilla TaxID=7936 RepID=A0A0E9V570_ANGAN